DHDVQLRGHARSLRWDTRDSSRAGAATMARCPRRAAAPIAGRAGGARAAPRAGPRRLPPREGHAMTLGRHARHYLLIGGVQWLVDWGVLVLLTHYGMQVEAANVCGRIAGALLGYWLNGKITFAGEDTAVGRTQLMRFVAMWLGTTAVSTWSMGYIDDVAGLK